MLELALDNIKISFGAKKILQGVSGKFRQGTINSIIGINGVGKSVLMKGIAKLLPIEGQAVLTDGGHTLSTMDISYVPQMSHITSALTAEEMVLLGKVRSLRWRVDAATLSDVQRIMSKLKIEHLCGQKFSQLSGGQKQMVIMAQSLIARPKVLLLDEPTSALDLFHQLQLLEVTCEYCTEHGAIAVVVMHDLSLISRYSDTILLLHEGKSICQGSSQEILKKELLERVFGVEVEVSQSNNGYVSVTPIRTIE